MGFLTFTACQLTPNIKITDASIYNKIKHWSFTFDGGISFLFVGKSNDHKKVSNNILRYNTNDLVSVEYGRGNEKVIVIIKSQGTRSVSY